MTTTDMHGRAYDWNSYTNSALNNNFLQAAKLVAERRAAVDDSILIDVGDILQGSALSSCQHSSRRAAKTAPWRLRCATLAMMPLCWATTSSTMRRRFSGTLQSADLHGQGRRRSARRRHLLERRGDGDERIRVLPYKTFTYKFEDGTTFTIGLLGFENMNNANWDVASHYEGCTFGHTDNAESPMSMSGKTTTARKCRRSATTSSSPCTRRRGQS